MTKSSSLLIFLISLIFPLPAQAGKLEDFSLGLAFGLDSTPYRDYDLNYTVLPVLHLETGHFYIRDNRAGVKLWQKNRVELSVFGAWDAAYSFNPNHTDNRQLNFLETRRESATGGGAIKWGSPIGLLALRLEHDLLRYSSGFKGQASLSKTFDLRILELNPQAGLYWNDQKYNTYYFGINEAEALASGLPTYQAQSAFIPYIALNIGLGLDEEKLWTLFITGQINFLPVAIKDSPMVDRSSTYNLATGLTYSFR
ncbi:MAG: MipA/OmpV family protein [Candidatus Adiutrix intracellularis]|jgi:outer membrane protein|nr:MipA/OmpV family protein [Candidatus Adiutrix intracellularis]